MALPTSIPVLSKRWTAGDLEDPITVRWNEAITTETSELAINRPDPSANITVAGVLLDAATGFFEYPWSAGQLVAGENQLMKARLITATARRKSTEYFMMNVDEDIP